MQYISAFIEKVSNDKKITRWKNTKAQALGGAATGAVLGGLLGAGAGGVALPAVINAAVKGKAYVPAKEKLRLAALGIAGGALYGGLSGGASSGLSGAIVGSGVTENASDAEYAMDQTKRKALLGAGLGAATSVILKKNPIVGAGIGAATGGLSGIMNSMAGRQLLRKVED